MLNIHEYEFIREYASSGHKCMELCRLATVFAILSVARLKSLDFFHSSHIFVMVVERKGNIFKMVIAHPPAYYTK